MKTELTTTAHYNWIMLPPGKTAILRFPFQGELSQCELPEGLINPRLATAPELIVANQGYPFPWGTKPEASETNTSRIWKERQIGVGGLVHNAWFVTDDGRMGGAPNVPKIGPGALRHYMYLDGGTSKAGLAENEGLAIVAEISDPVITRDYRRMQLHAAEHVSGDRGAIIIFPKDDQGTYYVGFVGKCMECPNPELISVRALKHAVPDVLIELHPDWKNWRV